MAFFIVGLGLIFSAIAFAAVVAVLEIMDNK